MGEMGRGFFGVGEDSVCACRCLCIVDFREDVLSQGSEGLITGGGPLEVGVSLCVSAFFVPSLRELHSECRYINQAL